MENGSDTTGEPKEIEAHREMVCPWFQLQQANANNSENQAIESVEQSADITLEQVSEENEGH